MATKKKVIKRRITIKMKPHPLLAKPRKVSQSWEVRSLKRKLSQARNVIAILKARKTPKPRPFAELTFKSAVLLAIKSERDYQEKKYPRHRHTVGEWLLILEKCLADAKQVWISGPSRNVEGSISHRKYLPPYGEEALDEIRQVTAVGVAAMEQCGAPMRVPKEDPEEVIEGWTRSPKTGGYKQDSRKPWTKPARVGTTRIHERGDKDL